MEAPATTGMSCMSAPHITMVTNPRVTRCVDASNTGVQRPENACGPAHSNRDAAAMPNSGALKKKRSGTDRGGARSSDNGAVFTSSVRH
jgi:hypothetical protein